MPKSILRSTAQRTGDLASAGDVPAASHGKPFRHMLASSGLEWPEIDPSLLEERRGTLPSFPVDLMPPAWRAWLGDTAGSACAPIDYTAQALLGTVSGLCGAGASVQVTPTWREPLVLCQLAVGRVSSGPSPW